MATEEKKMATRKMTVTSCDVIKEGETKGRAWALHKIRAEINGARVEQELVSFEPLPIGVETEFVVKKREKPGKFKTFVSFTLSLPKAESNRLDSPPKIPLVPRGRYAVRVGDDLVFVRVWRGSQNPFAQRTYLLAKCELATLDPRALHGIAKAEGERLNYAEAMTVVTAIAADPAEAAREFGSRTGSCFRCSTELEVNLSRKLLMGPECMKHVYEDEERLSRTRAARAELREAGIDPAAKYDDLATV